MPRRRRNVNPNVVKRKNQFVAEEKDKNLTIIVVLIVKDIMLMN